MEVHLSSLGVTVKKQVSPAGTCNSRVARHSLTFSPRDGSLPPDNLTPCGVARGWRHTSELLSISSTYRLAWVYCCSGMLASPLGKAGFLQFLPCRWVSGQLSSLRVFSQPWQEGSRQAHCSSGSVVLAKIRLPAIRHTGGQDFSQGSQSSTKELLFTDGWLILCCKGDTKRRMHDVDSTLWWSLSDTSLGCI